MDHKALISSLSPDHRAALLAKSNRAGFCHLAIHWGLIATLGWLISAGVPGWQVLVLPQGVLIIFCFTLQHECVHKTPFRTGWVNEVVMRVCAVLVVLPPTHFRYFHLAHHRHTNDPDHDPELEGQGPDTWARFFLTVTGVPVWKYHVSVLLRNAAGRCRDDYVPRNRRGAIQREAWAMLAIYGAVIAALMLGQTWLFWCWILPAILGQPFLRLYLMAEHGRCPSVANMLENTRTTYTNRIVRFLAWNMPYHAEHHAYPSVPFHKLPEFHRVAADHLVHTSKGYTGFHRAVAADRTWG